MVQVVGDQFAPFSKCLGLPLGSPYTQALSEAVLRLRVNGRLETLIRTWKTSVNQCNPATKNESYETLSVDQFIGLLYVMVACVVLSGILLVIENVVFWNIQKKKGKEPETAEVPEMSDDNSCAVAL